MQQNPQELSRLSPTSLCGRTALRCALLLCGPAVASLSSVAAQVAAPARTSMVDEVSVESCKVIRVGAQHLETAIVATLVGIRVYLRDADQLKEWLGRDRINDAMGILRQGQFQLAGLLGRLEDMDCRPPPPRNVAKRQK